MSTVNPLTTAIYNFDNPSLRILLENGSDINGCSYLSYNTGCMTMTETPVVTAARVGNLEAVKMLVERGCNLNEQQDCEQSTPLQISANRGHTEIVQYLISAGADINYPGYLGFTPILEAAMENHLPVIKILTENGAVINCRTSSYEYSYDTLLMMAVVLDQDDIAEYLLKSGADVNIMNNSRTIPLAVALTEKKDHLSRLLILAGSKLKKEHLEAPHVHENTCQQFLVKSRVCPLSLLEISRIAVRGQLIEVSGGRSIDRAIALTPLPMFLKRYLALEM